MQRTRLSSKGQIVLPKSVRDARAWTPGMEFTVEAAGDGVLLRPAAFFPPSSLQEVAGCLHPARNPRPAGQRREAIESEVKRRHDRGRY